MNRLVNLCLPRRRNVGRGCNSYGFSLVELMIAMILGLLVVAGVIQLFVGNRITYSNNEALARVQESGRFALEIIKPFVRGVGDSGFCGGDLRPRIHLDVAGSPDLDFFNWGRPVVGWEAIGTRPGQSTPYLITSLDPDDASFADWGGPGPLPPALRGRSVPGSDILVIRRQELVTGVTGSSTATNNPGQPNIVTNTGHGIAQCEIVMVTNCSTGADIFQNGPSAQANSLTKSGGQCSPGNLSGSASPDWSTSYADDMQLYRTRTLALYVGWNEQTQQPGLFQIDLTGGSANVIAEELVEGVENMQLLFGFSDDVMSLASG
ncbi:MAG: prepilin-type N-terminal cleavage/methylation domain-containing protein, partial [Wenzhouxiangella sp.]|nr:prepilin-type N-terminal cleavage/methylation domain-containing protein [Wenzhouxiangella sp.]